MRFARAFTFVEVMIVVVVISILAAVVIPRFGGVSQQAKAAATESSLGGVRASIAAYRTKQVLAGLPPFPSVAQLTATGTVVQNEFPVNPFTGVGGVQTVTQAQAQARTVSNPSQFGWNYYVDNAATPPVAIFYANSTDETDVPDGAHGYKTANRL